MKGLYSWIRSCKASVLINDSKALSISTIEALPYFWWNIVEESGTHSDMSRLFKLAQKRQVSVVQV